MHARPRRNRHRILCLFALALAGSAQGCGGGAVGTAVLDTTELTYCCDPEEPLPVKVGTITAGITWIPFKIVSTVLMSVDGAPPWVRFSTKGAPALQPAVAPSTLLTNVDGVPLPVNDGVFDVWATECRELDGEFTITFTTNFVAHGALWTPIPDTKHAKVSVRLTCPPPPIAITSFSPTTITVDGTEAAHVEVRAAIEAAQPIQGVIL